MSETHPTVFVSYSWDSEDHKAWVKELCTRLRADGVDVRLDQWDVVPGDQLPSFMERSIRDSRFVIIVCTPRYKEKSHSRSGGVGYEDNIITAEVAATQNERKFIPVLASGDWPEAAPSWVLGKAYVDLRGDGLPQPRYEDLLVTLHGTREARPQLGPIPSNRPATQVRAARGPASQPQPEPQSRESDEIRIIELVANEVTQPRNDGTRGSALYAVPFRLSKTPSAIWEKAFVQHWDRPSRFTSMHRPGIARVRGDRIILDGTTVEEVEKYHKETLLLAVEAANEIAHQIDEERRRRAAHRAASEEQQRKVVQDAAKRIRFD
jgi:hypothetical protein